MYTNTPRNVPGSDRVGGIGRFQYILYIFIVYIYYIYLLCNIYIV
jgi:hypothetical protein